MNKFLAAGARQIDLSSPVCMGIINATPDSFSDGSELAESDQHKFKVDIAKAMLRVESMVGQGALIVDVGGESTRPGAEKVLVQEELDRVIPIIEAIRSNIDVCISVDTSSASVMTEALSAGAEMVNDIRALADPDAVPAIAQSGAAICLMHMQGQPRTMQQNYEYQDLVAEIYEYLDEKIANCLAANITSNRIIADVGFGFGKSLDHNYQLLKQLDQFHNLKVPLLVGISRKSMIGGIVERPPQERVAGSIAATTLALEKGAHIVRTHDVAATVDAIRVHSAYKRASSRTSRQD